jgi:hypothetical protein
LLVNIIQDIKEGVLFMRCLGYLKIKTLNLLSWFKS